MPRRSPEQAARTEGSEAAFPSRALARTLKEATSEQTHPPADQEPREETRLRDVAEDAARIPPWPSKTARSSQGCVT